MNDDIAIPIVAILMPLILVPTVMVLKQRARAREQLHRERMRAYDLGLAPGPEAGGFWPALAAISIGFGVPAVAFAFALLATLVRPISDDIWGVVAAVSVIALICGTVLAVRLGGRRAAAAEPAASPWATDAASKPAAFDPDAYDTVSRRG